MRDFIKRLFSSDPSASGKRVAGFSGWILFCTILTSSIFLHMEIAPEQEQLLDILAKSSVVMLVGGVVEQIVKPKQK